ncbi:MAG TPA: hypothetical protein VG125_10930 [Pirellulales bacterium]|jgi:hypothetical protein|nr:hypothetical protein [Pirellulales bacterium]
MARLLLELTAGVGAFALPQASAQTNAPPLKEQSADLRAAAAHMQRMELSDLEGQSIDIIEHPLLAYADPARVNSKGSVWAWGKTGRPLAFLELFRGDEKDTNWVQAVTLTSSRPVKLALPGGGVWQPAEVEFASRAIPDAPAPDEKASIRLRQSKEQARRFTAHEFWDPNNSRFELRLLVQPVHRYSDSSAGIQDGAAFIIAHGTNPETVLLIEALGPSVKEARWHFALARSSNAEAHVELDGQEVWKCDRSDETNNGPTRTYWLFTSPVEKTSDD